MDATLKKSMPILEKYCATEYIGVTHIVASCRIPIRILDSGMTGSLAAEWTELSFCVTHFWMSSCRRSMRRAEASLRTRSLAVQRCRLSKLTTTLWSKESWVTSRKRSPCKFQLRALTLHHWKSIHLPHFSVEILQLKLKWWEEFGDGTLVSEASDHSVNEGAGRPVKHCQLCKPQQWSSLSISPTHPNPSYLKKTWPGKLLWPPFQKLSEHTYNTFIPGLTSVLVTRILSASVSSCFRLDVCLSHSISKFTMASFSNLSETVHWHGSSPEISRITIRSLHRS